MLIWLAMCWVPWVFSDGQLVGSQVDGQGHNMQVHQWETLLHCGIQTNTHSYIHSSLSYTHNTHTCTPPSILDGMAHEVLDARSTVSQHSLPSLSLIRLKALLYFPLGVVQLPANSSQSISECPAPQGLLVHQRSVFFLSLFPHW